MKHALVIAGIFLIMAALYFGAAAANDCSRIWIDTENVSLKENTTDYFYFPIHNDAGKRFDVYEIAVYKRTADGNFSPSATDYSTRIAANSSGELTVRIAAGDVALNETREAYIQARGQFYQGDYCGFGDIGNEYFGVTVERSTDTTDSCSEIRLRADDIDIEEGRAGTYSFSIENTGDRDFELYDISVDEGSSYFTATLSSKPDTVRANSSGDFRVRIGAEQVSADREGTVELRARGRFAGGTYCSANDTVEEQFSVFVENSGHDNGNGNYDCEYYGDCDYRDCEYYGDCYGYGECRDISLDSGVVRVARGETANATFYVTNNGTENFLIDYIAVFDNSNNFIAESSGYGKVSEPRNPAFLNVNVRAYNGAALGTENAYVEVRGRFQGGESCTISGSGINNFQVIIEEPAAAPGSGNAGLAPGNCSSAMVSAPVSQTIAGSGIVPVTINNTTYNRIAVRLQGTGITANPALISVPKQTKVTENVLVETSLQHSTLVYSIEGAGCTLEKATSISNTGFTAPNGNAAPGNPVTQAITGFIGFGNALSAGFAVLGRNLGTITLIVIALLLFYLVVKE